jgi:NAD(P)-dependent dehydrogenase (short-subunit alcohol dehydrogenase family)
MSKKNVLVTGAAGFIGPQVVRLFLEKNFHVVVLDKLTYAGNTRNLEMVIDEVRAIDADVDHRYEFIHGDICDLSVKGLIESRDISWFVNLAAESHVDRSIGGAPEFLKTEVQGTLNLLEIIRSVNDGETPQVASIGFQGLREKAGINSRRMRRSSATISNSIFSRKRTDYSRAAPTPPPKLGRICSYCRMSTRMEPPPFRYESREVSITSVPSNTRKSYCRWRFVRC